MTISVLRYCHECGKRHLLNHVGVGLPYRMRMRILHRFNLCWVQPVGVSPGAVYCSWCGMRGRG